MEEIKLPKDTPIIFTVKISSDAVVGSNISVDDELVKKSIQYSFSVTLDITGPEVPKTLSSVTNFFVSSGSIEPIMKTTSIKYELKAGDLSASFSPQYVKINDRLFMGYMMLTLT